MDHREQLQKDAEKWQSTSVKMIQRIRYGVLIVGLAAVLILFLRNLNFQKEVDHTFGGVMVYTESGEILSCDVRMTGKISEYPFARGKFALSDELTVFVEGKRILTFVPRVDKETGSVYGSSGDCIFGMTTDRSRIFLETDVQEIFPEAEKSERCLLIHLGEDKDHALLTLQDRIGIPDRWKDRFSWFTGE